MKDFIDKISNEHKQVINAENFSKNEEKPELENILKEDSIKNYGDFLKPILMFYIDQHKDNPIELKTIVDFARNHKVELDKNNAGLDKNTYELVDKYLVEEASKTTFFGRILNFFGLLSSKASKALEDHLSAEKPSEKLGLQINEKKNKIIEQSEGKHYEKRDKSKNLKIPLVKAILCSKDDKKNYKEIFSNCIKEIYNSKLTDEEKIATFNAIKNMVDTSTTLSNKQKAALTDLFAKKEEKFSTLVTKKETPLQEQELQKINDAIKDISSNRHISNNDKLNKMIELKTQIVENKNISPEQQKTALTSINEAFKKTLDNIEKNPDFKKTIALENRIKAFEKIGQTFTEKIDSENNNTKGRIR